MYLSTGPQVVDDSLDPVHHLQPHLLLFRPWGDVLVKVVDLLVQPAEYTEHSVVGSLHIDRPQEQTCTQTAGTILFYTIGLMVIKHRGDQ